MHRSSELVAALAAALAKAQSELVNPEKSLTAIIRTGRPGEGERSFRYAPLSSGLDIVRKTLGQHEIATVQTTAIEAGVVNLTTMLAHASGEWIASDWPVCPVAETANPQRMGAALTYARRYALFTLVGIAGEDDLDAPDLCAPAPSVGPLSAGSSGANGGLQPPPRTPGNGQARGSARAVRTPVLPSDELAALRDRLLGEIASLQSEEGATKWAREALPAKNRLTVPDARLLEDAFEKRLSEFLSLSSAGGEAPSRDGPEIASIEDLQIRTQRYRFYWIQAHPPGCVPGYRQERARPGHPKAASQQGPPAVCDPTAMPSLRPQTIRRPSHPICAAARAGPQGQR